MILNSCRNSAFGIILWLSGLSVAERSTNSRNCFQSSPNNDGSV